MSSSEDEPFAYNISILVILRWFVLWGIFESVVFIMTKGDRVKELVLHIVLFVFITLAAHLSPSLMRSFTR